MIAQEARLPSLAPKTLARLAPAAPHRPLRARSPLALRAHRGSVVVSAQTTDVLVNKAAPKLFARFPDAKALAAAEPKDVEAFVSTLGVYPA